MLRNFKISLFGVFPSTKYFGIGGVSIHLSRLLLRLNSLGLLDNAYNSIFIQNKILKYNNKKLNSKSINEVYNSDNLPRLYFIRSLRFNHLTILYWFFKFVVNDTSRIFHFHNHLEYYYIIILIKKILKKNVVITIHDQMQIERIKQRPDFLLFKILCKQETIKWIAVNKNIKFQLTSIGTNPSNIFVIPAYLKNTENGTLPEDLLKFTNYHFPIVSTYAVSTSKFNEQDLYGIDLSLDLLRKLILKFPNLGLVICIPGIKDVIQMTNYYNFIKNNKLEKNVYFQLQGLSNAYPLWRTSNIFLRLTNTDGDSLSVREALECGCTVIASDIVERPIGCVIFKNRDIEDLTLKALSTLSNLTLDNNTVNNEKDYFEELLKVYNSFNN
jgi:glycosyltransferase involved in cell wall biosynthesis